MKKQKRKKKEEYLTAYIMLLPVVILLAIFVIGPLINSMRWSFYNWSFYKEPEFVGVKNYLIVLRDKYFLKSIMVGLKWVAIVVPANFIISFFLATFLKSIRNSQGSVLMKTMIYVPHVTSVVIAAMIFTFLIDPKYGIINIMIKNMGFKAIPFLAKTQTALPSVAIVSIWLTFGMKTLIMLAGLNDIPTSYYEAARIDGAGFFKSMWYITLPSMKNIFLFLLVTSTSEAFQEFRLIKLMTNGGPINTTTTPNMFIYWHFYQDTTMGYTMAAAILMFIIMTLLSIVLFRVIQSEKMS